MDEACFEFGACCLTKLNKEESTCRKVVAGYWAVIAQTGSDLRLRSIDKCMTWQPET